MLRQENLSNPISIAVARSIGQAVATAHMADHSLGAAIYALKAVKFADKSIDAERKWQNEAITIRNYGTCLDNQD